MLRRTLTTFISDDRGAVVIDMVGISAILVALTASVFGLVISQVGDTAHIIQLKLQTGPAEAGVVLHTDMLPPSAVNIETDG